MIGLVYEIWKFWENRLYRTLSFISLKTSDMIEISISNERGKREEEKEKRKKKERKHDNRDIVFKNSEKFWKRLLTHVP